MALYLDHNATTPLDGRVLEAMLPFLRECYGNPSSLHSHGRLARQAVEAAREQVAALVGAHPAQVVFTSGGTEANNLALYALSAGTNPATAHVSAIEHASVLEPAERLVRAGWTVARLPVDAEGQVDIEAAAQVWRSRPRFVSVMYANNETGVIQPVAELAAQAREHGVWMHTDAVQAAGKARLDFTACGVHLMSLSAHKIYGPKGVGALVVDPAFELQPLLVGGGQEQGRRSGTEHVAGIVGFGMAAELAGMELESRPTQLARLRGRLEAQLARLPGVRIFGAAARERLPNTVYFAVRGLSGEVLLMALDRAGVAVSSGSACDSAKTDTSHVLRAMGVEEDVAQGAVRVSLGRDNTAADVDALVQIVEREQAAAQAMWAWG